MTRAYSHNPLKYATNHFKNTEQRQFCSLGPFRYFTARHQTNCALLCGSFLHGRSVKQSKLCVEHTAHHRAQAAHNLLGAVII